MISQLSEREKETLRLLLAGHDAKSAARALGLSIHTVNERLREARRKLGVGSSREAARLLADSETGDTENSGTSISGLSGQRPADQGLVRRMPLLRAGGLVMLSLILAGGLAALHSMPEGAPAVPTSASGAVATTADIRAQSGSASRDWLALIDSADWPASWRTAATAFRAAGSASRWRATIVPVRRPLGRVQARRLERATRTTTLPGAPPGDYEVLEYRTDFSHRAAAIETVVMVREPSGWKVAGYFIR